jgi:hypothetical protein
MQMVHMLVADKKYLYSKDEKCGGLLNDLYIAIGSRVMLRRNMDTSKGIIQYFSSISIKNI